jgi:Flp pilus assembly protein TadD
MMTAMSVVPAFSDYERGLAHASAGRHLDAIEAFEAALSARPNDGAVLFALGNTARALGMAGPAENFYRRVLALEPGRLEAIVNLANLLRAAGNAAAALATLEPALARNPCSAELLLTLGTVHREAGAWDKAEICYRAALDVHPGYVHALVGLADVMADTGRAAEALGFYETAIAHAPGLAQPRLNRAILHFQRGDLAKGWRDYAARLSIPGKVPLPTHSLSAWDGGALAGKRMLVTAEQGVGDQLMFASVIPDLAARAERDGASLLLECEARLRPLFARSFPNVTVMPSLLEARPEGITARHDWLERAGGADLFCEMGTVPRFLRASLDSFPAPHAYLVPDADEKNRWAAEFARFGAPPYIGICWRSGNLLGHRAVQFAPLAAWADFIRDLPGTIVATQYDATPEEISALERASGRRVHVPLDLDQKQELDRTAALLSNFAAVASAPTAVSWLSAGLGAKTIKLLYDTSWTAFGQTFEPFAPSCLCAMPEGQGDWASAFAKARTLLS